ncbi:hypothetical protein OJ997_35675 [Solirubrobacter phytolaccae]|uniref:Uncharacterized protein n=1 Tax=Solirubrobacter phytolaccae TaxID=1404360 RepID=A0A9X3NGA7_9ACTN|nr:hypothetical protein [Solirubrobacter phytolaccae]MDA0185699.1 hypothetical protein [Solirubrobacter phytolaccae]
MLARTLAATGTERSRVLEVAQAEARGDVRAVLNAVPACARQSACVAATTAFVNKLKRGGEVEILQYKPSVQAPLTTVTGTGRVAWRAGNSGPIVQCVRVRRDGPASGAKVELLSISAPIGNEEACP